MKKILISAELLKTPVGVFFQNSGLECETKYNSDRKGDYLFIVNDYCPEIKDIPRIKIDPLKVFDFDVESNVRGVFDQRFIDDVQIQKLIKMFLTAETGFSLVDSYSDKFKNISSIKIHEYLNVGFFIDTIVIEAFKNKFDFELIRKYLNQVFEYSFDQIKTDGVKAFLNVDYSFSDNVFAIEISFSKNNFSLAESLVSNNGALKLISDKTNFFNANYYPKRGNVNFSSLWFNDKKIKNFKSFFYSETGEKTKSLDMNVPIVLGLEEKENVQYIGSELLRDEVQAKKLSQGRKFFLFIKNFRMNEEEPLELSSLVVSDIDNYLLLYPLQKAVIGVDEEVKQFILKLLQNEKLATGIEEYITIAAKGDLAPQLDQIQKVLAGKSLADLEELVTIKNVTEHFSETSERVGQSLEAENENTVLKNVTDQFNSSEKWEMKRSEIVDKIKEEAIRLKADGGSVYQEDIIRIISQEVDINDEAVAILVKDIVEEVLSSELTQGNNLEEAFPLKFIAKQAVVMPDLAIEKLENQLHRMMKITAKLKSDFEMIVMSKDSKINSLEERMEKMKSDFSAISDSSDKVKVDQLLLENKNLNSRLEFSNLKLSTMNENLEKQFTDSNAKKDSEISTLKSNIQIAKSLIENFKLERRGFENKLNEERQKHVVSPGAKREFAEPIIVQPDVVVKESEAEKQLSYLTTEKKILEEKFKIQGIELKKFEQKLKFTTAQLEESQRKKAVPVSNANTKSSDVYAKLLENATARINDASLHHLIRTQCLRQRHICSDTVVIYEDICLTEKL